MGRRNLLTIFFVFLVSFIFVISGSAQEKTGWLHKMKQKITGKQEVKPEQKTAPAAKTEQKAAPEAKTDTYKLKDVQEKKENVVTKTYDAGSGVENVVPSSGMSKEEILVEMLDILDFEEDLETEMDTLTKEKGKNGKYFYSYTVNGEKKKIEDWDARTLEVLLDDMYVIVGRRRAQETMEQMENMRNMRDVQNAMKATVPVPTAPASAPAAAAPSMNIPQVPSVPNATAPGAPSIPTITSIPRPPQGAPTIPTASTGGTAPGSAVPVIPRAPTRPSTKAPASKK